MDSFTDHGTDGSPDRRLDSVMFGPLHIEDGIIQFDILGIDPTETMFVEHTLRLVENTDLIEADELPFTEMIDE